jgi:hypothetical protein
MNSEVMIICPAEIVPVTVTSPTVEEKRAALDLALHGKLLSRSLQLRNFLQFVCEAEMSGRSGELTEYVVGVEALGRPQGYSTGEDAGVRRLAHILRERLDELYRTELAGARLRIELPKGSYTPRYVAVSPEAPARPAGRPRGRRMLPLAAAFLAGIAVCASVVWVKPGTRLDPVLAEAWGPLAHPGANTVICLGAPLHYTVLPRQPGPQTDNLIRIPKTHGVWSTFRSVYPSGDEPRDLFLSESQNTVRLGELRATVVAVRLLTTAGVDFRVMSERDVTAPSLHSWNVLVLANPEFSYAANMILSRAALTVATDAERNVTSVRPTRPGSGSLRTYTASPSAANSESLSYGLITVTPGDASSVNEPLRAVVISGTDEAACQSAAEFFCSARRMNDLRQRFRKEGLAGFPKAYQAVLKCRTTKGELVSSEYEAHVILER